MTIEQYDNWLYENRPSAYVADTVLAYWMKRHLGTEPSWKVSIQNLKSGARTEMLIRKAWNGNFLLKMPELS